HHLFCSSDNLRGRPRRRNRSAHSHRQSNHENPTPHSTRARLSLEGTRACRGGPTGDGGSCNSAATHGRRSGLVPALERYVQGPQSARVVVHEAVVDLLLVTVRSVRISPHTELFPFFSKLR